MSEAKQIGQVMLLGARCRCGHEWLPRSAERPLVCPKCKSPRWDLPKQITGAKTRAKQKRGK